MIRIVIFGWIILASCSFQAKNEQISKEDVIEKIEVFRQAGFFEKYDGLSNSEVYDKIYEERKKYYSEIFERPYDPGMDLEAIDLAAYDKKKVLFLDLEADVGKDNDVYVEVIKSYSELSNFIFKPIEIVETWESETGPIEVSFKSNDSTITFSPAYQYDWLDVSVFILCQKELNKKGIRIVDCLDEDGSGYGQAIAMMRLTEEEQKILENGLNWKFSGE